MHPVEERLVRLRERWDLFRDDSTKRLLIWQLPENAMRFAFCFFEAQHHDTVYAVRDLFIVVDTPFENSIQYSRELKQILVGRYKAGRDALEEEGIEPDWTFEPSDTPDLPEGFVQLLQSFASHHPEAGYIVPVFAPSTVTDLPAWIACVERMLKGANADRVRYVLLDSIENPRLNDLSQRASALALVDRVHMDAWETAQETFAKEAASGPAGVFRSLLAGLFKLVDKGSADQVMLKATDALAFVRRQGWFDQEVVVRMLAAGGMLKEKRFQEAVSHYYHAREAASKLAQTNPAAAGQLTLQSWFGEAGAHFCAGDPAAAARCYDAAIPVAEAIPSPLMKIEALRMSAQSYLQAKQPDLALERSLRLLDTGRELPEDQRMNTTLPIGIVALLRMIEPERVDALAAVKHELDDSQALSLRSLEQRAAAVTVAADAQHLNVLEETHVEEVDRLEQAAKQLHYQIAAQGNKRFVEVYRASNDLLGAGWLIDSSSAILPKAGTTGAVKRGIA